MQEFPGVTGAIFDGIHRNLHTGVQVYVSLDGQPVLDAGFGMAAPDQHMTDSTIMLWRSAGKPVTAAAVCRLFQHGTLDLDVPLSEFMPTFRGCRAGIVTLRQILTHATGLPVQDSGWPQQSWDQIIGRILAADALSPGAAYQPQSTWFLLGEILQQLDHSQRPFQSILRDDVLHPLGMNDTECGLENASQLSSRLPVWYSRERGKLVPNNYSDGPWLTQPSPGGNLRGPVRELGRFYEMLLNDGRTIHDEQFLTPEVVTEMTSRHRSGEFDHTFQHVVDFGLGLMLDSNTHGAETVPYGFGRHSSPQSFGHGGSQCAMGFCDPDRRLVVAWAANGICGEGHHQRRNSAINEAIYTDLRLSPR